MTVFVLTGNTFGVGSAFTFAAAGDELIVAPGALTGSSTGDAIADTSFDNVSVTILGSVTGSNEFRMLGVNAQFHVGVGGSWVGTEPTAGNGAIYMGGTGGVFRNDGTFVSARSIGVITASDTNVVNTGRIEALSAVWLGLSGAGGSLVNSGSIIASGGTSGGRFDNGVQIESSALVYNMAGGHISSSADTGAGVNYYLTTGGSQLVNHGEIVSVHDFGVDLSDVSSGQALIQVFNAGMIEGGDGSYRGSVNADSLTNRGNMVGSVQMGGGADLIDNRNGVIDGDVLAGVGDDVLNTLSGSVTGTVDMGDGDDTVLGNAAVAEVFNGGLNLDTLDFRYGGSVGVALDLSFDNYGAALGDTYSGFERVMGSALADVIRGGAAADQLLGMSGVDVIDGAEGADLLRGGTGIDTLTGGLGNDTFRFVSLAECGDVITDFRNVTNDNDRFQIQASNFGGGLVAGALAANQFQSRADNVAQDADDRFIYRTTDRSLWFDVDGNGAAAAVMVADLQAGATVTAVDVVLI